MFVAGREFSGVAADGFLVPIRYGQTVAGEFVALGRLKRQLAESQTRYETKNQSGNKAICILFGNETIRQLLQ